MIICKNTAAECNFRRFFCYIMPETVSTKCETELTAFCIVFFVFLLFEPMLAVAPAITEPTAIATPRPFMMFCVFFFIILISSQKILRFGRILIFCKSKATMDKKIC